MKRKEAGFATDGAKQVALALGRSARNARVARGWSREELAQRASTSTATLQRLEGGGVGIALGTWLSVLDVLGMLRQLRLQELRDPVAEHVLDQTRAKRPIRPSDKDLDF